MKNKQKLKSAVKICTVLLLIICYSAIIINSKAVKDAAYNSIVLCIKSIIPSLFPIMILSTLLSEYSFSGVFLTSKSKNKISTNNLSLLMLIVISITGGYPIAGIMSQNLYSENKISYCNAKATILALTNPGIGFTVIVCGNMLGSVKAGILLYCCVCLSDLVVFLIIKLFYYKKTEKLIFENKIQYNIIHFSDALTNAVNKSVSSMLNVSAWIILFNAVIRVIIKIFSVNEKSKTLMFAEITNTINILSKENKLADLAFFLCFGCLCIMCQLSPYLIKMKIKISEYLIIRVLAGALSYCITNFFVLYCLDITVCVSKAQSIKLSNGSPFGAVAMLFYAVFFIYSVSSIIFENTGKAKYSTNMH